MVKLDSQIEGLRQEQNRFFVKVIMLKISMLPKDPEIVRVYLPMTENGDEATGKVYENNGSTIKRNRSVAKQSCDIEMLLLAREWMEKQQEDLGQEKEMREWIALGNFVERKSQLLPTLCIRIIKEDTHG